MNEGTGSSNNGNAAGARTKATARLRAAVVELGWGRGSREELQCAAAELVGELKQSNLPPEQMLLEIKSLLADVGLRPTYLPPDGNQIPGDPALYREVIMSSIRAYYASGPAGEP